YQPSLLMPTHKWKHASLEETPQTKMACAYYQSKLQEAYSKSAVQNSTLLRMQSTVVLQSMYCDCVSGQLVAQEEKQKKLKTGQLNRDRLPRLLTGDEFYGQVVEHQKAAKEDKIEHKNRWKQKEAQ
ncbi:hypothetical protein PAXRUDRAFT_170858, partial [Paxillus rubicundulus Ve08.2h10]